MVARLTFPNPTRSFDEVRNAVRFVGYEDMVPVAFFVEVGALSMSGMATVSEAECLAAFDSMLTDIHNAARRAYSRSRDTPCTLTTADF